MIEPEKSHPSIEEIWVPTPPELPTEEDQEEDPSPIIEPPKINLSPEIGEPSNPASPQLVENSQNTNLLAP